MIFLATAVIIGIFAVIGTAGVATEIARILFFMFLAIWAFTLLAHRKGRLI